LLIHTVPSRVQIIGNRPRAMMPSAICIDKRGATCVVTLDNPPVNALNQAARRGLLETLSAVLADDGVTALVVTGAGRMFSAGADIREFGDATRPPPYLREVVRAFDASTKPIVAAIHGAAFGGALELAMACHYRVATPDAKLALSEVRFGIIPGAGGTQLLPRLIGPERALDMIATGEHVDGRTAMALGLVDLLFADDLLGKAMTFARDIAGRRPLVRASQRRVPRSMAPGVLEAAEAQLNTHTRGAQAPRLAVTAVQAAVALPFEQGLERERELWAQAAASPEAGAMRYVFAAERTALKVPGLPEGPSASGISKAAVIGTGTMATGIAIALADSGIDVTLVGRQPDRVDRAMAIVARHYAAAVESGGLSDEQRRARLARIAATISWDGLGQVDLAIEAVAEETELKKQILANLDAACRPDAVLATSTSSLNVEAIASVTRRPAQVIGLHFLGPQRAAKLVEIVRVAKTANDVTAASIKLVKQLGKPGVVVRSGDGQDGIASTRMFNQYLREANLLLAEGALPQEIDAAMVSFGMAMGPLATSDVAANAAGAPVVGQVERRSHPGESEIVERCTLAMVNEGSRLLDEGIALRASDIDVIWVDGYGFPRHRGGPMYHADRRAEP
jgi:3-hydroxyacyl-CoA dehydrogenase